MKLITNTYAFYLDRQGDYGAMNRLTCPECGREVNVGAFACLHCGCLPGADESYPVDPVAWYRLFYEMVVNEEKVLKDGDISGDYRRCKALASCYELQDYLANILSEYRCN